VPVISSSSGIDALKDRRNVLQVHELESGNVITSEDAVPPSVGFVSGSNWTSHEISPGSSRLPAIFVLIAVVPMWDVSITGISIPSIDSDVSRPTKPECVKVVAVPIPSAMMLLS